MITVEEFIEPNNFYHHNSPRLQGHIYKNVLSDSLLFQLKREMTQILNTTDKISFLSRASIHNLDDKKIIEGINLLAKRYQNVLYDLTFLPDYWYQTNDTMINYAFDYIYKNISPIFVRYIHIMKNCKPFDDNKWVPFRLHLNYLPTGEALSVHTDGSHMLFKMDNEEARLVSLTYYAETVPEGLGGELYSINGFVYRPIANTAIGINGNQVKHGVTQNASDSSRLAFTMRWAHIDDLFLPGHPSKHVWKVEI